MRCRSLSTASVLVVVTGISNNTFLAAARGEHGSHTPVWFMRQAGRSLPEYKAVRGDGSILRALSFEARTGAPVLGVNFGRVGFLATIEQADLERSLTRALRGDYITLGLPSLKAVWIGGTINAVNDLAFLRGGESRLADLSYSVDGESVATVRCDGLICSTPVGSTAYNLAAGGPTVSWKARAFVISFIAAHHLDTRPLILAPEESLVVTNSAIVGACDVLADGVRIGELPPGRSVTVGLGGQEVHLAIFPESSFFRRYREKFGRS